MADQEEYTWAVVETHKGVAEVFSYRGRLRTEQLRAWQRGELQGALTLEHAYWLEQRHDRVVPYVIGERGDYRNARGVLHIDVSTVSIIIELEAPDAGVLEPQPGAPVLTLARSPSTGRRRQEQPPEPPKTPTEDTTESDSKKADAPNVTQLHAARDAGENAESEDDDAKEASEDEVPTKGSGEEE